MDLQQAADEAMEYLDSVGVAADYDIRYMYLEVFTENNLFNFAYDDDFKAFMLKISETYPQKSPA